MSKRDYKKGLPSVSSIIGVLRKIPLELWFKNNTPEDIKKESEKSLQIGNITHEIIQNHIEAIDIEIKTEYAIEVTNTIKSFLLFKKEHPNILLKKAELKMESEELGYCGTLDCLAEQDGEVLICDWKTSKKNKIYDEYKLQVSAYVKLYNEVYKTDIKKAIILCMNKLDISFSIFIMEADEIEKYYEYFTKCQWIYNFQKARKAEEKTRT